MYTVKMCQYGIQNLIHFYNLPRMDPLWVDKHRPRSLQRLDYHPEITDVLRQLADTDDFPHIVMYGPEGAGKKTRAYAFLAKIFGDHVFKLKEEERVLKPEATSTTIEFSLFTSNYHIEMTPSDNDHNDRHIVQNVVKEIAGNTNIQTKSGKSFKVLIINQADKLTKEAQGGLRRTMEKYIKNCRMILLCSNLHRLIQPIRSRCLNIRVPAPQKQTIRAILTDIGKTQSTSIQHFGFSSDLCEFIANNCDRNLRLAIMQLQASKFTKNTEGMLAPYKKQIRDIVDLVLKEQSPMQLKKIRDRFYDLLVNCIQGQTILREMLEVMLRSQAAQEMRQECIKEIVHQGAEHERTLLCGSKAIYHLQSFAAHVMEQVLISKNHRLDVEK